MATRKALGEGDEDDIRLMLLSEGVKLTTAPSVTE
jgi:hypothetical protein